MFIGLKLLLRMKKDSIPVLVIVIFLALILCGCSLISGFGLYFLYMIGKNVDSFATSFPFVTATPEAPIVVNRPLAQIIPADTITILENTIVPENNLPDLACRLSGKCNLPLTLDPPAIPPQIGGKQTFWVTNVDTHENFQVTASLRYISTHVYFWVQDDVDYRLKKLKSLAEAFENQIYPTDRAFFGSEWTPGVDGDSHIYILYARGLGPSLAGYYSYVDEYNPLVHEYSNAHEMFLLNADNIDLGEEFTYGVLAHEFQHMIHWNLDRNETSWLNEGFSELAAFLNGYDVGGFDWLYVINPDLQLTDWPNDPDATSPHYGAGFLFLTYFLDRFGEEAEKYLAANPLNGMESVDDTLRSINAVDPTSGKPITADDVLVDWMITNYLLDGSVANGQYLYHNYPGAPAASSTEDISSCPSSENYSVHQYGADYLSISCVGDYTLTFTGSTITRILPVDPHSGSYAFWSNKGDESNMTLTKSFDFTGQNGPITLSYWTWYDLEEDYDYLYLEISEDGQHWQIITVPSGTIEDPSGISFGWAYNGISAGGPAWIQETVDLSEYAGKVVQVRFEYVTDAAINGEGLLLDDIAIPEIDYQSDFEKDDGGWDAAGFVRIENGLPQIFRLALILKGKDTTVQMIPISPDQSARIPLSIGSDVSEAVLLVTGTTRFTRELAYYSVEIR